MGGYEGGASTWLFQDKVKAQEERDIDREMYGTRISNCCGAPKSCNGDVDTEEIGICPQCGEHCEYIWDDEE